MSCWSQNTILWKVEKQGSEHVSYLLGTFHQMGNSFVDEKPIITDILFQSDVAVFESIEDRGKNIIEVMNDRDEDFSYKNYLNTEDIKFLENYTKDWSVPLSKQRPAELLIKLQQNYIKENCGTIQPKDKWEHMDDYILNLAKSNNIKVEGLETYSDQFDAINIINGEEFTWEKAKDAIHFWAESLSKNKNKGNICANAKDYLKLKFDYQFNVKCAENDGMLSNRNENWMPKIINYIESSNSFIAVGLLHLFGECGIISQLRNQGYEVTRVKIE